MWNVLPVCGGCNGKNADNQLEHAWDAAIAAGAPSAKRILPVMGLLNLLYAKNADDLATSCSTRANTPLSFAELFYRDATKCTRQGEPATFPHAMRLALEKQRFSAPASSGAGAGSGSGSGPGSAVASFGGAGSAGAADERKAPSSSTSSLVLALR